MNATAQIGNVNLNTVRSEIKQKVSALVYKDLKSLLEKNSIDTSEVNRRIETKTNILVKREEKRLNGSFETSDDRIADLVCKEIGADYPAVALTIRYGVIDKVISDNPNGNIMVVRDSGC